MGDAPSVLLLVGIGLVGIGGGILVSPEIVGAGSRGDRDRTGELTAREQFRRRAVGAGSLLLGLLLVIVGFLT